VLGLLMQRPLALHRRAGLGRQVQGALGDLARKRRESGGLYTAYLAVKRLVPPRVAAVDWVSIYGRRIAPSTPGRLAAAELRWAGPPDLAWLSSLGHAASGLARRMARGDRVAAMARDGELLGYTWFHQGPWEEMGFRVRPGPDEIWGYDALVARAHRGRGIGPRLINTSGSALADEGFARVLSSVNNLNRNMLRVHERIGARSLVSLLVLRLGSVAVMRQRTRAGVRWRAGRVPIEVALPEDPLA
jgi:GNAT superfamily N-acetyltransferase